MTTSGPREACGLFGMWGDPDAAAKTYYGLFALQHRGQESAGIASTDGVRVVRHRGMGTLPKVFSDPQHLRRLKNPVARGHVRYSTTGASQLVNAQPLAASTQHGTFAVAHNGNLTNTTALAEETGMLPGMITSDTDLVAELLEAELAKNAEPSADGRDLERALCSVLPRLEGAFSFVLMDAGRVIGEVFPTSHFVTISRGAFAKALDFGDLTGSFLPMLALVPVIVMLGAVFLRKQES